jgi:DNA polymerase-3 subunit chi
VIETIKLYQANKDNLFRSTCLLLSKCFKEGFRTLAVTKNHQDAITLDTMLWTFSQQSFIPHALSNDDLLSMQPIVISVENLVGVNFDTLVLLERFDVALEGFKKVMLMFAQQDSSLALELRGNASWANSNYYIQNSSGEWVEQKL